MDSLTPTLDAFGLDGVFKVKEKQHEGLATFYRRSAQHSTIYKNNLKCNYFSLFCDYLKVHFIFPEQTKAIYYFHPCFEQEKHLHEGEKKDFL